MFQKFRGKFIFHVVVSTKNKKLCFSISAAWAAWAPSTQPFERKAVEEYACALGCVPGHPSTIEIAPLLTPAHSCTCTHALSCSPTGCVCGCVRSRVMCVYVRVYVRACARACACVGARACMGVRARYVQRTCGQVPVSGNGCT